MLKEIFDYENKYEYARDKKFHISSVGQCWRRLYLKMKGLYIEQYDSKTLRNFSLGNKFHNQAREEIFEKAGNCNLDVVAAETNIPEQELIAGKADLILSNKETGELFIADIKSCGNYTLNQVRNGEVPQNYIWQLQLYLHFFKIKRGYVLFFGKEKGEIEEVEVTYDKTLCEKLIADIISFYKNNVEKDLEPAPCDKKISPWGCPVCSPGRKKK